MGTTTEMLTNTDQFISLFKDLKKTTFSSDSTAISQLREYAISHYKKMGIPTRKEESWKYTPIAKALKNDWIYHPLAHSSYQHPPIPNLNAHELIIANNQYRKGSNPLPKNIVVSSISKAFNSGDVIFEKHYGNYGRITSEPFTALNTAFAENGIYLQIPEGVSLDHPIHIITILDSEEAVCIHPRNLIVAGNNSSVKIIESTYVAKGATNPLFINAVSEIICGENASVDRCQIQNDGSGKTTQVNTTQVYQMTHSNFTNTVLTTNTAFTRNNINVDHDGEYCETNLYGIYTLNKAQHLDNHTLINHNVPNCMSNELYAGILNGNATGVFNGKVYVKKDAQKTNAFQSNKNILLSDDATINSKPELEIYADDVKCSHGSTTGQLEEDALFYLRSRGISEETATSMLLFGFVSEVIERIKIEPLKEFLTSNLITR